MKNNKTYRIFRHQLYNSFTYVNEEKRNRLKQMLITDITENEWYKYTSESIDRINKAIDENIDELKKDFDEKMEYLEFWKEIVFLANEIIVKKENKKHEPFDLSEPSDDELE